MKKTIVLRYTLAVALSSAPAMAADFHALAFMRGVALTPLQDSELATTEGGASSDIHTATTNGGVSLCAFVLSGASTGDAQFTVANALPVTAAQYLQVVN